MHTCAVKFFLLQLISPPRLSLIIPLIWLILFLTHVQDHKFTISMILRIQTEQTKKAPLVFSLWLLAGSAPVSGQAHGMSLSGSLLCFLFPPLPSCHFPRQTNNSLVQCNTVKVTEKSLVWVDGAQSFRSCVKYYPSAGTEVISDHFGYCVLWRNWGGCLSGWTKVYCVAREGASSIVIFGWWTFALYDVVSINYRPRGCGWFDLRD